MAGADRKGDLKALTLLRAFLSLKKEKGKRRCSGIVEGLNY